MNNPYEVNENSEKRYYQGWINMVIRLYYYLQEGLNQVNQWKYILAGVLAFAYLVKIESYVIIGLIFLALVPIFVLIGYLWIVRGKKSTEYFTTKYTSPFGMYGFQLQERQTKLLEEISKKLDKK
jgi:hypothetical protein